MDKTNTPSTPGIIHLQGEGKDITVGQMVISLKVSGRETDGAWTLLEYRVPPRVSDLPLHWHAQISESFYVLSGTLTVQIEARTIQALPGSFVMVTPRLLHRFSNEAGVTATFLSWVAPSGLEDFLSELSALARTAPWPPPETPQLAALKARYDIHPLPND